MKQFKVKYRRKEVEESPVFKMSEVFGPRGFTAEELERILSMIVRLRSNRRAVGELAKRLAEEKKREMETAISTIEQPVETVKEVKTEPIISPPVSKQPFAIETPSLKQAETPVSVAPSVQVVREVKEVEKTTTAVPKTTTTTTSTTTTTRTQSPTTITQRTTTKQTQQKTREI